MCYSQFDAPESKDCRVLSNQVQPLVWLRCLHSPSSKCDCENSMVSHSKVEICGNMKPAICSNYVNSSLYSTFTQCLECLGAELTTMKCIVGVKTNNPRTPRLLAFFGTADLFLPKFKMVRTQAHRMMPLVNRTLEGGIDPQVKGSWVTFLLLTRETSESSHPHLPLNTQTESRHFCCSYVCCSDVPWGRIDPLNALKVKQLALTFS